MNVLQQILQLGTIAFVALAIITIGLLVETLVHRGELYRQKYEQFRRRQARVLDEIERSKKRAR